jgi:hypothetical protein
MPLTSPSREGVHSSPPREGVGVGQNLIKMKRVMMEILTGVSTWHQY